MKKNDAPLSKYSRARLRDAIHTTQTDLTEFKVLQNLMKSLLDARVSVFKKKTAGIILKKIHISDPFVIFRLLMSFMTKEEIYAEFKKSKHAIAATRGSKFTEELESLIEKALAEAKAKAKAEAEAKKKAA